jgi:hypothetical protein
MAQELRISNAGALNSAPLKPLQSQARSHDCSTLSVNEGMLISAHEYVFSSLTMDEAASPSASMRFSIGTELQFVRQVCTGRFSVQVLALQDAMLASTKSELSYMKNRYDQCARR